MPVPHIEALSRDRFFLVAMAAGPVVWLVILFTPLLPLAGRSFSLSQFLLLVVLFPVLEELAFRGLIQGYLSSFNVFKKRWLKISVANWLTSLLFTAAHFIYNPIVLASLVFLPSLIFGELRDRYQSTIPSIILHCFYNLGFFLTVMLMK